MITELLDKTRLVRFDDLADLTQSASEVSDNRAENALNHTFANPVWVGMRFTDWQDVRAALASTWDDGLEIVRQLRSELGEVAQPRSRRRKQCWREDDGADIDLDRARAGQPFWRGTQRAEVSAPQSVSIISTVSAKHTIEHRDILWRGAAILALTDALEFAGYRVSIHAISYSEELFRKQSYPHLALDCQIKQSSDPLDLATLVNTLSGWAYRSLWFRAKAIPSGMYADTLGLARPLPDPIRERVAPDAIVCDGIFSRTDAIAWLQKNLEIFS